MKGSTTGAGLRKNKGDIDLYLDKCIKECVRCQKLVRQEMDRGRIRSLNKIMFKWLDMTMQGSNPRSPSWEVDTELIDWMIRTPPGVHTIY